MELSGKKSAILFLDRNRFDLYVEGSQNVLSFPFEETVINAMDVLSPVELDTQIKAFVEQNGISPANIMVILSSNVIFEKDIEIKDLESKDQEIETFSDNVPFENVYIQSLPIATGIHVIAANRDLCDSIRNSFSKLGFGIDSFVPYIALGLQVNIGVLDLETSKQIIKNLDSMRHYAFPIEKISNSATAHVAQDMGSKPRNFNIKLYAMIGILGVLILVLLFLLLRR